jgi:hypothetical protein
LAGLPRRTDRQRPHALSGVRKAISVGYCTITVAPIRTRL